MMKDYRVDPADDRGVHLVDVANGGERVYIPYKKINEIITMLGEIKYG